MPKCRLVRTLRSADGPRGSSAFGAAPIATPIAAMRRAMSRMARPAPNSPRASVAVGGITVRLGEETARISVGEAHQRRIVPAAALKPHAAPRVKVTAGRRPLRRGYIAKRHRLGAAPHRIERGYGGEQRLSIGVARLAEDAFG